MGVATAFIPEDRRQAIAAGEELPGTDTGAVLFVDISGFTSLAESLRRTHGPQRGAEILTRQLNAVYTVLIDRVNDYRGSVLGFSGDAITCWFGGQDAPARAVAAALAIQIGMGDFTAFVVSAGVEASLAVKAVVATGPVRRFLVGDPNIQRVDVLAGSTLDRMADLEKIARPGEVLVDAVTAGLEVISPLIGEWRTTEAGEHAAGLRQGELPGRRAAIRDDTVLTDGQVRPWVLPAVYQRLTGEHGEFLAELRPAAALFLQFGGLDYDHDPEAADKLDAYVRWVQRTLARYEGALVQLTTGDKGNYLYVAFGAPVAHDDDPRRAVAAALELRSAPAESPEIREIRIGVSQGIMRVGPYGSPTRQTYGVLGDETNMAARLMMQAEPGQVLVTERLAADLAGYFDFQPLGLRSFKGKTERQPIHAAVGVHLDVAGQLALLYAEPLVGREAELALLRGTVAEVLSGQGRVARIQGEAGAGKSHLAAHFASWAGVQGLQLHIVACQSTTQSATYQALRPVARVLVGLAGMERDPDVDQILQLERTLQAQNPAWLPRSPLLGDLLGIAIPDSELTAAMEARLRQESLLSLVVEILEDAARRQPTLLLCEDIHWLDEATQKILSTLARVRPGSLLILLVHRPLAPDDLFLRALADLPDQTFVQLADLNAEGIGELVRRRLGGDVDALALEFIFAQSQGNPFFAEELVDALRERGHLAPVTERWQLSTALIERLRTANCLVREDERWVLAPDARLASVNLGIPASVHGLVLSRLDRLPEPSKLTLKVAAVIGQIFELEVLAAAHPAGGDVAGLEAQLQLFQERDFARMESLQPTPVYIFKHNITQEAVYQTLLETQQHSLHLAVAEAIEARQPDAVERLAYHYQNSDLSQPPVRTCALHYLESAAQRAQRDYANETALAYYDQALGLETRWGWLQRKVELLHILGQRPQEEATLFALSAELTAPASVVAELWADFHEGISNFPAARAELQKALSVYEKTGNRMGQAKVLSRIGEVALREGDTAEAESHYRSALALRSDLQGISDVSGARAEAMLGLGVVMRQRGEYDGAAEMLGDALTLFEEQENLPAVATALTRLGGVAFLQRDFPAALEAWEKALNIRRTIGDREGEGISLLNIAQGYTSMGDYAAAQALLRASLDIHRAIGNRWWENAAWNALGILALTVGDYSEAKRCMSLAIALTLEIGDEAGEALMVFNLGQVEREVGNIENAESCFQASLKWARANFDADTEAQCLTELALTMQLVNRDREAMSYASAALNIYTSLGLYPSTTTDLATIALVLAKEQRVQEAMATCARLLEIFDASDPYEIEYPQRDLYITYLVAKTSGNGAFANRLLHKALEVVQQRAVRISDDALRNSFLENVRLNRDVMLAAGQEGLLT